MGRIRPLDYLKTMAIIGVLLFHIGLIPNGYLGVEVFFVISGFLMMKSIRKDLTTKVFRPVRYILHRLAGFWPLIAACAAISLIAG